MSTAPFFAHFPQPNPLLLSHNCHKYYHLSLESIIYLFSDKVAPHESGTEKAAASGRVYSGFAGTGV